MTQPILRNLPHSLRLCRYSSRNSLFGLFVVGFLGMLAGCGVNANSSNTVVAAANSTASPNSLAWGNVPVGQAGSPQSVTLTNNGSVAISINSIGISGTASGDYSTSQSTCGTTLAPSASCSITVVFKPSAAGTISATLVLTDSGSASPHQISLSGTGAGASAGPIATVTVSPASLTFGSVSVGAFSGSQTITISNPASASVTLGTQGVTGTDAGDFAISSTTCGSTLAAAATCTTTIIFKPAATGARTANWGLPVSNSSTPLSVALSGTGSGSSGSLTVSPAALSFGTFGIETTSSAQSVTITNGTSGPVTLGAGVISGTNGGDFTITSTTCGITLAPAASCTVSITFSPSTPGSLSATWAMDVGGSNSTLLSVALSGTAAAAPMGAVTVNPANIDFGSVAVGSASQTQSVMLINNTSSAIAVSSVTLSGADPADFAINKNACKTSSLHTSCVVGLIFNPTAAGVRTATLTFTDSAGNSPQIVALTGTGTPSSTATLTISPSSLAFGSQNVGSQTNAQTFTLTAGGSGAVSFISIGFTGTDPGDFSITANACGSSLTAGSSCAVSVAFKPTAIGNRVALFSVADNTATTTQTAEVSGTGAYSSAQTPAITVDFGSRSGTQVTIPSKVLGTEYLESLPTNANRTTVIQGGFTADRYRLQLQNVFPSSPGAPSWHLLDIDMQELAAAGVHPLVILENTPTFLQPSRIVCGSPESSVPTNVNEWGQLAAAVVAHLDATFPGLVPAYEIWNEPNTGGLCSSNKLNDYISIYAAAAPQIKAQAQADGAAVMVGGPASAGVDFTQILTNPSTAPYVDFYSYHLYLGDPTTIQDGMTWDGVGGTPSLHSMILDPSKGIQARFLEAYKAVQSATTPLGAKTPVFYDEYNTDWAFEADCCRNSPTYSPLYNSMVVAQLLNSVYNGATAVPSRMIYFAAGQNPFCILGIIDPAMDCSTAVTGAQAQPYPQWYTYSLMFAPSYLDLQDGGNMASSVTLSSSARSDGLIATAYYTPSTDSILIINPTANSYSGLTLQIDNAGIASPASALYTINATNQLSSWPATLITASGNLQTTFDLPGYSVLAISLKN